MQISIGIDAAKEVHWATAVTQDGHVRLSRKVDNTAQDIGKLIAELRALGGERLVGIDLLGSIATLISAMLIEQLRAHLATISYPLSAIRFFRP